jgi:thiol-disulfide isomerase/thioredoxin
MHQVILLARLALCVLFAFAAIRKLRDRSEVAAGIAAFGVPGGLAAPSSVLLIAAELMVVAALLFDPTANAGAIAAIGLLSLFTIVLAVSIARGNRPACNCFGADEGRPIGWDTVLRNLALLGLGVFVAANVGSAPLLPTLEASLTAARTQGPIVTVGAVMLAALSAVLWQVVRQQGRLLMRLEALEASGSIAPRPLPVPSRGLAIGSPAPAFSLAEVDGGVESLDALVARDLPVLLLFVNPKCGPCQALLPDVARWQAEYASALTIALVSEGSAAENREERVPDLGRILLQRKREVAEAYHAYGTPAAVLIEAGRIASLVAQGAEQIRTLVADFYDGRPQPALGVGDPIPELSLETPAGTSVVLREHLGSDTVILFWNPQCGFCANMLDDLRTWERNRTQSDPELLIVSSLPFDREGAGLQSTVLFDPESRAGAAFGARGTPMAVRVDANARTASPVVAGRDAVLSLLQLEPVLGA